MYEDLVWGLLIYIKPQSHLRSFRKEHIPMSEARPSRSESLETRHVYFKTAPI